MPVHNAGGYLRPAVESILGQRYPAFELILVDDHSTDGAVESAAAGCGGDRSLKVLRSRGRGVVAAMAAGAAQADGAVIARMDADDIAAPDRLARQVAYLQARPGIGIAGGQVALFSDAGLGGGFRVYQEWINRLCEPADIERELFIESPVPNPTAMFRREVYEALGGYHDPAWPEDYDLFLRAHAAGVRMGKPEGIVLHWRDHDRRLTRRDGRYDNDRFMQAKGHYLARGALRERPAVIWGTGRCGRRFHDILRDNAVTVEGFIDIHPRRVGGVKRGLPVWPAEAAADVEGALIVGAVRARGAREEIRKWLLAMNKTEGPDFLFVA